MRFITLEFSVLFALVLLQYPDSQCLEQPKFKLVRTCRQGDTVTSKDSLGLTAAHENARPIKSSVPCQIQQWGKLVLQALFLRSTCEQSGVM